MISFAAGAAAAEIYSKKLFKGSSSELNLATKANVVNSTTNEISTLQWMSTELNAKEFGVEKKENEKENVKGRKWNDWSNCQDDLLNDVAQEGNASIEKS